MKIKKSFGLLAAIAVVAAAGWSYQQSKQYDGMSELVLANVEALADNESESNLTCEGWLGFCSFECDKCGADWTAIGSTMKGSHTCRQ